MKAEVFWKVPQDQSDAQRFRLLLLSAIHDAFVTFDVVPHDASQHTSFADYVFITFVQLSDNVKMQFITVVCL